MVVKEKKLEKNHIKKLVENQLKLAENQLKLVENYVKSIKVIKQ
jgi:hypothetical protein